MASGDTVRFDVERVTIEPFDLRQPCKYDLVVDRLTHWYHTSREWIKKAIIMDGLYVFNNPWSVQSNEKHTTYCAMMQLGHAHPRHLDDAAEVVRAARPTSSPRCGATRSCSTSATSASTLGYPMFMKPYDGGGWKRGHARSTTTRRCARAYDESGKLVMHLQKAVDPLRPVRALHRPRAADAAGASTTRARRCTTATRWRRDFISAEEAQLLEDITLTINAFFGWDFNSCEALRKDGIWYPIDFANPCPDSQVTSLHYHFPWLVKANLRWSIFCAATKRKMRRNLDWDAVLRDRRARPAVPREARAPTPASRDERFETDRFEEFCATHLAHLDEVAWEFFGTRRRQGRRPQEGRRRSSRRTRSSGSPSCSGSASSPGGAPSEG